MSLERKKIMITLGTFLSNRVDVLEKLIIQVRDIYPESVLIVSAGNNAKNLQKYVSSSTIIEEFIPQVALMPYIDIVIYHGGCNTFTEAMYYGKQMILLPFSSDQFNIAYDVQNNNLGEVIDPNNFGKEDLLKAFENLQNTSHDELEYWRNISTMRGSDYAVKVILDVE